MVGRFTYVLALACASPFCFAQGAGLTVPSGAIAGFEASLATSGSGDATFYLIAPDREIKETVKLGENIRLQADDLRAAGRYQALLCSETCRSEEFYVSPAGVADIAMVVHPSRVAVGQADAISGAIFSFDKYQNLVLAPAQVKVELKAGDNEVMNRDLSSSQGVSWFRAGSGRNAGPVQVIAASHGITLRRVVLQVASEPCNLRVAAQWTAKGIEAETQPVRDCAGNSVPDGTIVTFTATTKAGKSTVDAPIKQGIARAEMGYAGPSVISVASGVVLGNEVQLGARP